MTNTHEENRPEGASAPKASDSSMRRSFRFEKLGTAVLLVGCAVCFAYFLANDWNDDWFFVWVLLWAAAVFAVIRSAKYSGLLMPLTVLASLAAMKFTSFGLLSAPFGNPQRILLAISGIATIVLSTRYGQLCHPAADLLASQRMNYMPTPSTNRIDGTRREGQATSKRLDFGLLFSLAFLAVAWFVASYVSSQLTIVLINYDRVHQILQGRIGILPEWYVGLIVLFALSALLWLVRQAFSYLELRQRGGSVAAMHLRSELWKWDGSDQRRIGNELSQRK